MKDNNDDVWIVTYPETGTTWTQYIVHLTYNGGKDNGKRIVNAVPWIEAGISTGAHSTVTSFTPDNKTPPKVTCGLMTGCLVVHQIPPLASTSTLQGIL